MRVPDLLPCPFCGSEHVYLKQRPLNVCWVAECPSCAARGPATHVVVEGDEDKDAAWLRAKRQAAERWNNNRRTADVIREWMNERKDTSNE